METQTSQPLSEEEIEAKKQLQEIQQQIELKEKLANYYEQLSYAVKSEQGKLIITELLSVLNDQKNHLLIELTKPLLPPYEWSKEELEKQKAFRIKIQALNEAINNLDVNKLVTQTNFFKKELEALKSGIPTTPVY